MSKKTSEIGFGVLGEIKKNPLSKEELQTWRLFPTGNIVDQMGRYGAMDSGIKCSYPVEGMVGTAFTVRVRPTDNLMIHFALKLVSPGDVIVIDASGDTTTAVLGALMCSSAKVLGVQGIVIDGVARDAQEIQELGFPLFCRGFTPVGPYKDGPGEINGIISCGRIVVTPGDIIIGDMDGVVVVPRQYANRVLEATKSKFASEQKRFSQIRQGNELYPSWLDETLRLKGLI